MQMVQVIDGVITQYSLPKVGRLKDGSSVSGYDLLMLSDPELAREEGWLPLIDEQPEYNPETHYLMHDGYEIFEDRVVVKYKVERHIPAEPEVHVPSVEERLDALEFTVLELL